MTFHLHFDYIPDEVAVGEPFTAAVLLLDENDEPVQDVELEVTITGDNVKADTVVVSCGEALFDQLVVTAVPEPGNTVLTATADGLDAVESGVIDVKGGGKEDAQTAATADEELTDIADLFARLKDCPPARVKHYLMLIRGRMWGKSGNAERMVECGAFRILTAVLDKCDTDEAIECVAVVQELATNTTGAKLVSCASCRSIIREAELLPGSATTVLQTLVGLVFHSSCLLCKGCGEAIGEGAFVRSEGNLNPYHHPKCSAGIKTPDAEPMRCTVMKPDGSAGLSNPALLHFLANDADAFAHALKTKHWSDGYVKDRCQRMFAKCPVPEVHAALSELKS